MKTKSLSLFLLLIPALLSFSCTKQDQHMVKKELFGTLQNGDKIYSYILTNKNNMSAEIINYGATVVKLSVPDRQPFKLC
jgi:hypothetical protein